MPAPTVADLPRCGAALEAALEPFRRGDLQALEALLAERLAQDPLAVLGVLHDALFAERGVPAYPFSLWLLERRDLLPKDQGLLDLGLASAVYRWRTDALRTFLDLGADPNRTLIERRTALDICANRPSFFYSQPKDDLEAAVAALKAAGGKGWVEATLGARICASGVFEVLDTYDSWPEAAVSDLAGLDPQTQSAWAEVLTHCAVTAKAPSQRWLARLDALVERTDGERLVEAVGTWLDLARGPRASLIFGDLDGGPYYLASDSLKPALDLWSLGPKNRAVLKGLVWLLDRRLGPAAVPRIAALAKAMFQHYPLLGLRDQGLGSACVETLIATPQGREAARELSAAIDHKTAQKRLAALMGKAKP